MSLARNLDPAHVFEPELELVQSPNLKELPWLRHASTTRNFSPPGLNKLDEIRQLQARLGLAGLPAVYAQQKHTNNVGVVNRNTLDTSDNRFVFPFTDAIVCGTPNVTISIFTADCVPIFFADKSARIIALAHAGWQGTLARIAEQTIDAMKAEGAEPEHITAWIGPAIGGCCYEVGIDLIDRFRAEFSDALSTGFEFHRDRILDLVALNQFQMEKCGIPAANISASQLCTLHRRDQFHSYRGGSESGRIISSMTVAL